MDYKLPDIRDSGMKIQALHPDTIDRERDLIRFQYESVLRIMDDAIAKSVQSTCSICEEYGHGYDDIPEGWVYILGTNTLLCGTCLGRWFIKWDLPELSKEIEL